MMSWTTFLTLATLAAAPPSPAAPSEPAPAAGPAVPAPSGPATFQTRLHKGWAALQAGRFDEAVARYTQATKLRPSSEDAWVGLQRAQLGRRAWRAAAEAGSRALSLNPDNVWAHRFQALARYELQDYVRAREHYEQVLARNPDDPIMQLGLGFTLVRLGDVKAGHALCQQAGRQLEDEPRVAACLAMKAPRTVVAGLSLGGTYLGSSTSFGTLLSATTAASARWVSSGFSLWGGATVSRLTQQRARWSEVTPVVGLGLFRPGWEAWLAGALVLGNDPEANGAVVALAGGAWHGALVSVGTDVAVSAYPDVTVLQIDPRLTLRVLPRLRVTLGGEVQDVGGEVLGSGRAALGVTLSPRVTLSVRGWYGARRYAVDAGGFAIWNSADRFRAGWGASLAWRPVDSVTLTLAYDHRLGDQASAPTASMPAPTARTPSTDFELFGGTLAAAFAF